MLEKHIQRKILDYLNTIGKAIKIMESNEVGTPDILAVVKGVPYLLEVKQPLKNATPIQHYQVAGWITAGAKSAVVRSVDDVKKLIEGGTL